MTALRERAAACTTAVSRTLKGRLREGGPTYRALKRVRGLLPETSRLSDHPFSRIIDEFAAAHPTASFVQIGANDGIQRDPLRQAILSSQWSGLMVEPVPYVFRRLEANYGDHERVQLVNAAVAEADGFRTLYYLRESNDADLWHWYHALGSFREDVLRKHVNLIPDIDERIISSEVPCMTFASLCRRHRLERVDVVQIDTEGYDWEIIKLIDLDYYRPTVLMFEQLHLSKAEQAAAYAHMRGHGFEVYADGMDALCLRTTDKQAVRGGLRNLWQAAANDERICIPWVG